MKLLISLPLLLASLAATAVWADERAPQPIRVIPKAYISPGASGSIDSYQRQERDDLYGGPYRPGDFGSRRYERGERSSTVETRGGIRQRTEHPSGYEVQRYPGQDTQRYQQRR